MSSISELNFWRWLKQNEERFSPLVKYLRKTGVYKLMYWHIEVSTLDDPFFLKIWGIPQYSNLYHDLAQALILYNAKVCFIDRR